MNRTTIRGRLNRKCSCGSGKKYKNCCFRGDIERVKEVRKRGFAGGTEEKEGGFLNESKSS